VALTHNSLVAMHGRDFQRSFTHQIDKLSLNEPIGMRLSLNVRFHDDRDARTALVQE